VPSVFSFFQSEVFQGADFSLGERREGYKAREIDERGNTAKLFGTRRFRQYKTEMRKSSMCWQNQREDQEDMSYD
jgi:hypothetical protein